MPAQNVIMFYASIFKPVQKVIDSICYVVGLLFSILGTNLCEHTMIILSGVRESHLLFSKKIMGVGRGGQPNIITCPYAAQIWVPRGCAFEHDHRA